MQVRGQESAAENDTATVSYGTLMLNFHGLSVAIGGHDISVTLSEFLVLRELVRFPYCVLDRQRLASVLRGDGNGTESADSSLRAIDVHISRLRRKLRLAGYDCIQTMRFVGYRFVPVEA